MGIGYSRPSRPPTDPPSTQSVLPLGISNKVNEPVSENTTISGQSRHPSADRPPLNSSSSEQGHRAEGLDDEAVPSTEHRSPGVNVKTKKSKSAKPANPAPSSTKRPHSALLDDTVAGSSKSKQHNQSSKPLPKRSKKAAATSAYVTEPVVLARPRKNAHLDDAGRVQVTTASAIPNALAAVPSPIAAKATIEREDGELTDEDVIAAAPVIAIPNPIPTRPAADIRRPRYVDRDAMTPRTVAGGKATVSSQKARKLAPSVTAASMSASNNHALTRPKDTSSGLPYDDVYAEPTPQQSSNPLGRKGSSPYSSHLTPWAPGAVVQRMTAQGSPHHLTTGPNESHAYAYAPHFYQQYSPFAPYQLEQQAEPENGSLKSQDSGVEYNRYNDHRLNSDEDEDVDDQGNSLSRSEVIPPTN